MNATPSASSAHRVRVTEDAVHGVDFGVRDQVVRPLLGCPLLRAPGQAAVDGLQASGDAALVLLRLLAHLQGRVEREQGGVAERLVQSHGSPALDQVRDDRAEQLDVLLHAQPRQSAGAEHQLHCVVGDEGPVLLGHAGGSVGGEEAVQRLRRVDGLGGRWGASCSVMAPTVRSRCHPATTVSHARDWPIPAYTLAMYRKG